MKNRHFPFKKLIALILALVTICSLLASCKSVDEGNGSESASDGSMGSITIFSNGMYTAKLIHDGTAEGKAICEKLAKVISDYTGVLFISDDSYSEYAGDAILVGQTLDIASTNAYATLGNDSAKSVFYGNKYAVAFSSQEAADKLLTSFSSTLAQKATPLEIKIDSSWNLSTSSDNNAGNTANNGSANNGSANNGSANNSTNKNNTTSSNSTFNESALKQSASLPSLGTSYNSGQGSKTYIMNNADGSKFTSLCKSLETNGWVKYTTNKIGENQFATYLTKAQIVHVMFFKNKNQIRTAVDKRGTGKNGFALTGLQSENVYKKTTESKMIVCDIGNADWPGGMCIIYKLADGRFFIVDAGIGGQISDGRSFVGSSSGWIYQTLAKHASNPKNIQVAAWLITHPHSDHAGGLYDMALGYYGKKGGKKHTVMPKEMKQYVKIDTLIYNAPDNLPDCNREQWIPTIIEKCNIKNVVKGHAGQVFYYADLKFTIYGSLDIMIEDSGKCGDTNEYSLSIKTEFNGKTALLLGDSDKIPNKQLALIYKNTLKSDILQMAHHGYGDTGDGDVNAYCNPSWVLWVVSNSDQRSNQNINNNTKISNFSKNTVTHYKPGTGNLVFDSNWKLTKMTRNEMVDSIPKCDGSIHGGSCSQKSSFKGTYT
ncbi:MAG: MBL fold metallo-hydrolase [Clostridia bacterium]|nr:MBL fold metallo-hydrolase [Clostridia bacterium]